VYLWVGIADAGTKEQRDILAAVPAMGTYLKSALMPPTEVDAQGNIVHANAPVGFSAAVIPYLEAMGEKAQAQLQQQRLIASQDPATGLYGHPGEYYDENLALFSTGWSEQRYRFERDGKLRLKWK
jgi:endoglucanase